MHPSKAMSAFVILVFLMAGCSRPSQRATENTAGTEAPTKTEVEGDWKIVDGEFVGKQMREARNGTLIVRFAGDKFIALDELDVVSTFRLDTRTRPRQIQISRLEYHMTWGSTPQTKKVIQRTTRGIYSIKGDHLTICLGEEDDPFPVDFSTREGSGGTLLMILERVKPRSK